MNQMATNYRHVTDRRFIREHIELVRNKWGGEIRCATCHSSPMTRAELAAIAGISASTLAKFLSHQMIRQDIADKLRKLVKAVHE